MLGHGFSVKGKRADVFAAATRKSLQFIFMSKVPTPVFASTRFIINKVLCAL